MSPIVLKVNPANRLELATTIQNLIDMLDAIDGDVDFEPNLGANENHPLGSWMWDRDDTGSQLHNWSHGGDDREDDDEREAVCEDEGAQCDDEGCIETDMPGTIEGGSGL